MNWLFVVMLIEVCVGGGGRLLAIGPVTLRMILFATCLLTACGAVIFRWRTRDGQALALVLVLGYLLVHLPAVIIGAYRGADPLALLGDVQPSLYWLAAPFFAMVLGSVSMVRRSATLVWSSGLFLAVAYLAVLVALLAGVVNFRQVVASVAETGEFRTRGDGLLFYKGFLYLGIATVFLVSLRVRHWVPLMVLTLVALVLTLTRGFLLATGISTLLLLAYQRRTWQFVLGLGVALAALFVLWTFMPTLDVSVSESREISNAQRLGDLSFIASHATAATYLFGEGFGSLINSRFNVENTFLWALWKLGVVGVAFWLTPLVLCSYYFSRVPERASNPLACSFMFGVVLVYVETMTNPYLNNPIGLTFVMLAVFALRTLSMDAGRPQLQEPGTGRSLIQRGSA
jgi:hypothetical protein